jgi:hypothetical protein
MGQIFLHIGTLKTGTTAFQRWFFDNQDAIARDAGVRWYNGQFPDAREIAAICLDPHKETPAMALGFFPPQDSGEWEEWAADIRLNIAQELSVDSPILISCEGLCLLRSSEEIGRLAKLFPPDNTTIILALRNKRDFLTSWKKHLRNDFFRLSNDPTSFAYVKKDSWLVDYTSLIDIFQQTYKNHITVIDYDESIQRESSIIPALLRVMNIHQPVPDWSSYHYNQSNRPPRPPIKGMARPIHYVRFYLWKAIRKIKAKPSSR